MLARLSFGALCGAVLLACGREAPREAAVRGPGAADSTRAAPVEGRGVSPGAQAAGVGPSGEVRAVCAEVRAAWASLLGAGDSLRSNDTLVVWGAPSPRPGCAVYGYAAHGQAPGAARHPAVVDSTTGWLWLSRYQADGPDGSSAMWQKGAVRCQVMESWDGGDDANSTYVPADFYAATTTCWSAPEGIAVADTSP